MPPGRRAPGPRLARGRRRRLLPSLPSPPETPLPERPRSVACAAGEAAERTSRTRVLTTAAKVQQQQAAMLEELRQAQALEALRRDQREAELKLKIESLAEKCAQQERLITELKDSNALLSTLNDDVLRRNKALQDLLRAKRQKAVPAPVSAQRQEMEAQRDAELEAIESLEARLAEAKDTMAEEGRRFAAASKENKELHQLLARE